MTAPHHSREGGTALAMAMVFVAAVGAAALTLSNRSHVAAAGTGLERATLSARAAADGGLETARARLAVDPSWAGGTLRVGTADVTVACATATPGQWRVQVTAVDGRELRPTVVTLEADLRATDGLPAVTMRPRGAP